MIDGRNFFDHPTKNDLKTCCNIRKTATRQGNDYSMGCLLGSPYFKKYFKLIARDLSKKQKLEADPKAIQQINFTGNLDEAENLQKNSFFSLLKKQNKQFQFFQKEQLNCCNLFRFDIILI